MTISTSASSVTIAGNGATSTFNFSFIADSASNISVIYTDASGNETTLLSSQYTLSINPPAAGQLWGIGGTVTYPLSGSPIASGTYLTIIRTVPLSQLVTLSNQGAFYPQTVEQALDVLEMQIQQVAAQAGRALTGNISDPLGLNYQAPAVAQRAGQFVGWDSSGNQIAGQPSGAGVPISSLMQPVVNASSYGLALKTMGALQAFSSISALRANNSAAAPMVWVEGYSTGADGGEGGFWLNSADTTSADNGGTIIVDLAGNRWYRETNGAPFSILWFGGKGDGVTDNLAAWNAMKAVVAAQTNGARIVFPAGRKFLFSAQASFTFPANAGFSLGIEGQGATLTWPNAGGGLVINYSTNAQGLLVDGLRFTTSQTSSGTGLSLIYSPSNQGPLMQTLIRNVSFLGENMSNNVSFSQNWANCVLVNGVSNVNFDSCSFCAGNGAIVQGPGTGSFQYAIVVNFDKCDFLDNANCIDCTGYVQGLGVNGCNFLNFTAAGIISQNQSGIFSDVRIYGNDFAGTTGPSIVFINSTVNYMEIAGNTFIGVVNNENVWVQGYYGLVITGNNITGGTGTVGILIRGSQNSQGTAITGNVIDGCAGGGVILDAAGASWTTSANCLVTGNTLHACTVLNSGTNNLVTNNLVY